MFKKIKAKNLDKSLKNKNQAVFLTFKNIPIIQGIRSKSIPKYRSIFIAKSDVITIF